MDYESVDGDIDPEVTKMINQIFNQGVQLAKLLDPSLRGGAKVQVNVGTGGAAIVNGAPNAVIAGVVRELEAQGISRDKITPEMVAGVLESMVEKEKSHRVIEGRVIEESA